MKHACTLIPVKDSLAIGVLTDVASTYLLNALFGSLTALQSSSSYLMRAPTRQYSVFRLQMRLMCWDVDVVHHPDTKLVDSDYWSRLGVNLQYDHLYVQYLTQTRQLRHANPPTMDLPMLP